MHVRKTFRNIFSTWVGYGFSLLVGFLLAPFIVHHLGNTGYGIWILISSLTGYFGMLDLGLRQSVSRYVSHYMGLDDHMNVNRTLVNALAMLGTGGILAGSIALLIVFNFSVFKIEPQFAASAKIALLVAALNVSLALPMSIFNTVLFSLERFDILTAATIASTLTRTVLVVVFVSRGAGVTALAVIMLVASCCEYVTNAIAVRVLYQQLALTPKLLDWSRCRELFGFSIFRFIWIVANQLIFYSDSVVIGIVLNAAAITYYAIAGSLVNYGRNIVSLAADTFQPAATRLNVIRDFAGLRRLQIFGTQVCLLIGLPICIGYMSLGKEFIVLWMGKGYASSAIFLIVLTLSQFTSMSQYISAVILVAMAKHRVLAYIAIGEGLANLLLSIILIQKVGLIGVAIGTVIPQLITTSCLLPLYTVRAVGLPFSEYFTRAVLRPFIAAAPVALVAYALAHIPTYQSWFSFAAKAFLVTLSFAVSALLICFTKAQRESLRSNISPFALAASTGTE